MIEKASMDETPDRGAVVAPGPYPSSVGTIWNPGIMSSLRTDWATPRVLFEMLDREFHFTLDVCAVPDTAVCEEFFGSGALDRRWVPVVPGAVWCNPPYGRGIGKWVEKGYREGSFTNEVVMLLPARTDTQWFHVYCLRGEIRFLRGRLCFDDKPNRCGRCPFPSMIVIFGASQRRIGDGLTGAAYPRLNPLVEASNASSFPGNSNGV